MLPRSVMRESTPGTTFTPGSRSSFVQPLALSVSAPISTLTPDVTSRATSSLLGFSGAEGPRGVGAVLEHPVRGVTVKQGADVDVVERNPQRLILLDEPLDAIQAATDAVGPGVAVDAAGDAHAFLRDGGTGVRRRVHPAPRVEDALPLGGGEEVDKLAGGRALLAMLGQRNAALAVNLVVVADRNELGAFTAGHVPDVPGQPGVDVPALPPDLIASSSSFAHTATFFCSATRF